jgi:protein SCO1/2
MKSIRVVLALVAFGAVGWSMVHSARSTGTESPAPAWRGRFPNVPLRTHDGRTVRFYDDLVRGRTVTLNFMYIECEGICPGVTSTLVEVQKRLGERAGRDVLLISITLRPEEDTPERLRDYAARYGAGPGQIFLSGRPSDIERLRAALGFADDRPERDADKSRHLGILRMGNESCDWWTACSSTSDAAQIVSLLGSLDAPSTVAKAPLENPHGPPPSGPLETSDLREFEALRADLDRLHGTRSTVEWPRYVDEALSRMAHFLKLEGERQAAWRDAMKRTIVESVAARRRMEAFRAKGGSAREAWYRYQEDQTRAIGALDGVLDDSPRHRAFRDHGSRWLVFMEGHPDHFEKPR